MFKTFGAKFLVPKKNQCLSAWASPPGGMAGTCPSRFEIPGGMSPPEIATFKENFMHICQNFQIFQYFPNKVAEIRGEIGIWG